MVIFSPGRASFVIDVTVVDTNRSRLVFDIISPPGVFNVTKPCTVLLGTIININSGNLVKTQIYINNNGRYHKYFSNPFNEAAGILLREDRIGIDDDNPDYAKIEYIKCPDDNGWLDDFNLKEDWFVQWKEHRKKELLKLVCDGDINSLEILKTYCFHEN